MGAPIVYRWDDVDAPVVQGNVRRSLCDILRACLVDGYGAKPAAGWTLEYINETEDKGAFRNNPVTGTGFFLQVDGEGSSLSYAPIVRGYETMTSEDDGFFLFSSSSVFYVSDGASATIRPWVLIADDRAFYLYSWASVTTPTDTAYATSMFFGDIEARDNSDAYACALCATGSVTGGILGNLKTANYTTGGANYGDAMFPRQSDGSAGSYVAVSHFGGGPGWTCPGAEGLPYTPGDQIVITRLHLSNGTAYSMRGYMPGHYYPCHEMPFGQLETVSADKDYLSIRARHYSATGLSLISLSDWRT